MRQSEGLVTEGKENRVCHLLCSLHETVHAKHICGTNLMEPTQLWDTSTHGKIDPFSEHALEIGSLPFLPAQMTSQAHHPLQNKQPKRNSDWRKGTRVKI